MAYLFVFYLALMIFWVVTMWKVYEKAGQPGWGSIIPIYNTYLLCVVGGKPGWWVLLMLVPVVNIIIIALVSIGVAQMFGKSTGFGVGLWLLGCIFYPILAFGRATYSGSALPRVRLPEACPR